MVVAAGEAKGISDEEGEGRGMVAIKGLDRAEEEGATGEEFGAGEGSDGVGEGTAQRGKSCSYVVHI